MHYVVAVPVDKSLIEFIGKKGSVNGLTFYNRKMDDNVIVALAPTSIEEKFYAASEALLIADQIVLSTASVDKSFGEMLVACSLLGKRLLITKDNDIGNLLTGTSMKNFELIDKEQVVDKILAFKPEHPSGDVRVDIDHAFPVKGIGTVALGVVKGGTVKVHDKLFHTSGKEVEVRSMQSQDVDITTAEYGTRVGIALKNIEPDEIDKGDLLTSKKAQKAKKITAELMTSGFASENIEPERLYTFASNFSYSNARVEKKGVEAEITFEKPVAVLPGDRFLLARAAVPRIFASGVVKTVTS